MKALIFIIPGVVMLAVIIAQWIYIHRLKPRKKAREDFLQALSESRPALAQMIQVTEDDESRQLIRHRYDLLGKLLASGVSGDVVRKENLLDEVDRLVADRDTFMRETRLIYERMQPYMIETLRAHGLSDSEIEVCCLYALGLNGKSIQQYTRDGRHYQNVGLIRKKLGLGEHDLNIDGYIRSLLK